MKPSDTKLKKLRITKTALICCALAGLGGWLLDLFTTYRVNLHDTRWFNIFSGRYAYTFSVLCFGATWLMHEDRLNIFIDRRKITYITSEVSESTQSFMDSHWIAVLLSMQGVLTVGLFAYPAWIFFNYGNLPDLCIFVETLHNAIQGNGLYNHFHNCLQELNLHTPDGAVITQLHDFATHFRPYLYLLMPLYKLIPHPLTLFAIQALITGSAVWPMYLLGMNTLKNRRYALLATFCMGFHPAVLGATGAFFPAYAGITFMLWALVFLHKNKILPLLSMLILTISLKELFGLPVAMLGVLIMLHHHRILGLCIVIASLTYVYISLKYVIPYYASGIEFQFYSHYAEYGDDILSAIINVTTHPWLIIQRILNPKVLVYIGGLLITTAFIPLGSLYSLCNLPVILQNIFASRAGYALNISSHLTPLLVPFFHLAFIDSLQRINQKYSEKFIHLILNVCVIFTVAFFPLANHPYPHTDADLEYIIKEVRKNVPAGGTIKSNMFGLILPHLIHQYQLCRLAEPDCHADYYLLAYFPEDINTLTNPTSIPEGVSEWNHNETVIIKKLLESTNTRRIAERLWTPSRLFPYTRFPENQIKHLVLLKNTDD